MGDDATAGFSNEYENLRSISSEMAGSPTSMTFTRLESTLTALGTGLREWHQEVTQEAIREIIEKWRAAQPLTEHEWRLVEDWVVGDAAHFIELGQDIEEWHAEIRRVTSEILAEFDQHTDAARSLRLRGLIHDAIRISRTARRLEEARVRLAAFEAAKSAGTPKRVEALAATLESMAKSPDW